MSEPLVITISHKLGKEEALRRIKPALGKASENFPVLRWKRRRGPATGWISGLRAIGQAAAGNVQVTDDAVRLEVTLPWLLHKFGQAVQRTIEGRGRILLEKK